MAEKEERIIIAVAEPSLLEGGAAKIYPCMTRQDAIERMAKAICKISCACEYYSCGNCTEFLEHYTPDLAEAALDALLED